MPSLRLYAARALNGTKPANDDQRVGIEIVRRAPPVPTREIARNAGVDGSAVVGKLLESNDADFGFDAQLGKYTDMLKAGIVDPTKVTGLALKDAAAVAGPLVTTEVLMVEKPEPRAALGQGKAPEIAF